MLFHFVHVMALTRFRAHSSQTYVAVEVLTLGHLAPEQARPAEN